MSSKKRKKSKETLFEVSKSFGNSIKALNKLVPSFIVVLGSLVFCIVYLIIDNTQAMMGITVIVVLFSSIIIYIKSKNYGEAALSLVAGLLTVFTVEWTRGKFIVFITVWTGFSLIVMMIASVRIAAEVEGIFRQASFSISMGTGLYKSIEKRLERISDNCKVDILGPVERAKVIRLFCYKKLPIDRIDSALRAVGLLTVITKVDYETVALFVADVYKATNVDSRYGYDRILDEIYIMIREIPVPPSEFIEAFNRSRRLLFSKKMGLGQYFKLLKSGLESGASVEDISDYIASTYGG